MSFFSKIPYHLTQRASAIASTVSLAFIVLVALVLTFYQAGRVESAPGDLSVSIVAADNLIVDSNALSPSTYAPSVATVLGQVCNTGAMALTDVQVFIGDFNSNTPGIYPARGPGIAETPSFAAQHAVLAGDTPGGTDYSFTHVGGTLGTLDATRLIGTLDPGECTYQYWHFEYPRLSNGTASNDNGGSETVFGTDVDPANDLWLRFDVWATDSAGSDDNASHRMYMRNEISANANKIRPNPDGVWFNTETSLVQVGQPITSNGILYELGNINQGFDNDGDGNPDYNAWLQPIGDPEYDPTCFRLIKTSGVLTVSRSAGNPDLIINFDDTGSYVGGTSQPQYGGPLYFTNLPYDNTGVRGEVYYTFVPVQANCATALSPYQEVASGFDNEKFNGDFGSGIPPIQSTPPDVSFEKSAPATISEGTILTSYYMTVTNAPAGTDFGLEFVVGTGTATAYGVIEDQVPVGIQYSSGSAAFTSSQPGLGATPFFSIDGGATWSATDPAGDPLSTAGSEVIIRWYLDGALGAGATATTSFDAFVPNDYLANGGSPLIENCADLGIAGGLPFDEACDTTLVSGPYTIGDFVWRDLDNDGFQDGGSETGIDNVTVDLYFDANGDGKLDAGDTLVLTTVTSGGGTYAFNNLPGTDYLVVVDSDDPDIPFGYKETTPIVVSVLNLGTAPNTTPYLDADFGFGPSLTLDKWDPTPNPIYEGDTVTYDIVLTNSRPGTGGAAGICQYEGYSQALDLDYTATSPTNKAWQPYLEVDGNPDNVYAASEFANTNEDVAVTVFDIGATTGAPTALTYLLNIDVVNFADFRDPTDQLIIYLYDNNGTPGNTADDTLLDTQAIAGGVLNTLPDAPFVYEVSVPSTALATLTMADFANGNVTVEISANGGGGSFAGYIRLDAVGVRLENGLICNDPDDIIQPLPLSDTYEADKLQFVSASPAATSNSVVGTAGTINWADVGPLDPGETLTVTVTFLALEPSGNVATTTQNCADSSGGFFPDGSPTNDPAQDCVVTPHNPTASIGDLVWANDVIIDGNQDAGEEGIPNVTVYLCTSSPCSSGNAIDTQVTDANGNYLFEGVRDGSYFVAVDTATLPAGSSQNFERNDGTPDNETSATVSGAAVTTINSVACGGFCDLDVDFGYQVPNAIFGVVWEDVNGDGTIDSGEEGFNTVTVSLCNDVACASVVATTTTDANGNYYFGNVANGTYYVQVTYSTLPTLPVGDTWTQTGDPDEAGVTCAVSCDDTLTGSVTVNSGDADGADLAGSFDFGYQAFNFYSLGDTVYADWNGDGDQDTGEEGISGVDLTLYEDENGNGVIDPEDALIATTTTDGNGNYIFGNLPAGNYIVVVDESDLPAGYSQTQDPDEDPGICDDCDGQGQSVGLNAGTDPDNSLDFGYKPTGTGAIGDYVWKDLNADNVQDSWESGLPNIQVCLYEDDAGNGAYDAADDALIGCVDTDADGNYLFEGLAEGSGADYVVVVDDGDSDLPTRGGELYELSSPSADNPSNTHAVSDLSGSYLAADFGFYPAGIIGDYVFEDTDADGDQDAGEPGIAGVDVSLYICGDVSCTTLGALIGTDTTDANGYYVFTGLAPNDYIVVVDGADIPAGWTQSSDPDETGICSTCDEQSELYSTVPGVYGLGIGQIDRSRDFGYVPTGRIGDTVWVDADGDGVKDLAEQGIPEITVNLYNNASCTGPAIASTTTDDQGEYAFGGLGPGTYCVEVVTGDPDWPGNVSTTSTYEADPTSDNQTTAIIDSNGDVTEMGGTGCTGCEYDADFGYPLNGNNTITGTVFYDAGNDGGLYNNLSDTPFAEVTVRLYVCADPPACTTLGSLVAAVQTDVNGFYSFGNLPDGNYIIAVDDTTSAVSAYTETRDPDFDPCAGSCDNRHAVNGLAGGTTVSNRDFGYFGSPPPPTAIRLAGIDIPVNSLANVFMTGMGLLALVSLALWRRRRHQS